jgi:hypothetical protein
VKDYSSPVWSGVVELGVCVFGPPQLTPAFAAVASCHENGKQDWSIEYTCQEDDEGTIDVCRSVACPGSCFYNNQGSNGKEQCQALPGFVSWNDKNHLCELTWPGVSSDDFQLNPGKSADGCLDKHDN